MATNFGRNRHGNAGHRNSSAGEQGPGNRTEGNVGRHGNGGNGNGGNGNGGGYEFRATLAREQLYEILHVIFKRKRLIGLLFMAVAGPLMLSTMLRPKRYVATAKVNISSDRASVTIQPSDVTDLTTLKLNESIVNSEVHLIRSRNMLENVIQKLAIANAEGGIVGLANAADGEGELGPRVLALQNQLKVTPIRASNVIQIEYASSDQKRAAEVVKRVLEEYIAYHAQVHGRKGLPEFYEEQSRVLEQNLRRAEASLHEFAVREGIVEATGELKAGIEAIAAIETDLRRVGVSIVGAEEKLRVMREQLAEQPALVKRVQYISVNPVVQQLTTHLIERKMDQVALLRKYTEKDRHVRDSAAEIADIEKQLDQTMRDQPTVVSQQIFRSNPLYDGRLTEILDLEANLKFWRARKVALEEELDRSRKRSIALKQRALGFMRLEQEVDRRRQVLELYEKRGQEARISEAMDRKQLVNVEILERPALPLARTDERGTPLLLAIISGLAVGLGGAFGIEYLNRTLRFERDVEQYLGLPVLGTVTESERA